MSEPGAWASELTRLEAFLVSATALLGSTATPATGDADREVSDGPEQADAAIAAFLDGPRWEVPTDLGPVPEDLRERATELLAQQREVAAHLVAAMRTNTRQRGFADRISGATVVAARPVYLDVTA